MKTKGHKAFASLRAGVVANNAARGFAKICTRAVAL